MDPSVTADTPPVTQQPQGGYVERRRAAALESIRASQPKTDAPPAETTPAAPEPTPTPTPTPESPADDLAAIRKQEIHLRRQIAEERQQWLAEQTRREAEYKPKLDEYETLKQRMASAKDDPIGFLQAAGYSEADFEQLARLVYAHSPEGAKDPRNKTAAVQTKAQRELEAQVRELQQKQTTWEKQQQTLREQAEAQALEDGYFATLTKALGDESPITKARVAAMPGPARARLLAIADRLYTESGPSDDLRDVPDAATVIKAYEAERASEVEADLRALPPAALQALLKKLGVEPAAASAPAKPAAPTLTPGAPAPTPIATKGRKSRDELVADIKRLHSVAKT